MTLANVAKAIAGEVEDTFKDLEISGNVVIDSRKIKPGDLFVAIKGNKVDGHNFIAQAIKDGAVAAISSQELKGQPVIKVKNGILDSLDVDQPTIIALGKLANHLLDLLPNILKIAVTGSSGKTTTKDLLSDLGLLIGPTVFPQGSYNNEIGLPQTILKCDENTKVLILEMGARKQGNIGQLCAIAKPDISIILNIGSAHQEIFTSREAILEAKSEIITGLTESNIAILNKDDAAFEKLAIRTKANIISFGEHGDVSATNITLDSLAQATFDLNYLGQSAKVSLKISGLHQVSNALAAAAPFLTRGIPLDKVSNVLSKSIAKSLWRMNISKNSNNITIINDSYNANPQSMTAALEALKIIGAGKNTWAILGEMKELGSASKNYHEEIAQRILDLKIENSLLVGTGAKVIFEYLQANKYAGQAFYEKNVNSSVASLEKLLKSGDVCLVKASRSIGLDYLANAVENNFDENLMNKNNQEAAL